MDFWGKVISLIFNTLSRFGRFPSTEQMSFNFMAAVTSCSDLRAQENKICPQKDYILISNSILINTVHGIKRVIGMRLEENIPKPC